MHPRVSLTIPQPCHQNWAAMSPVAAGRHCAACAKTVVDFTLKTDAEILAYLVGAASGRTCGRFAAGQLERPLQRAAPAAPTRWRAWLAAAVAVWSLREGSSAAALAQATQATQAEWRARHRGGPVPASPPAARLPRPVALPVAPPVPRALIMGSPIVGSHPSCRAPLVPQLLVLRGVVTDSVSNEPLPGVTVLLAGTTTGTSTLADGTFELAIAPQPVAAATVSITLACVGYVRQERQLATKAAGAAQHFRLRANGVGRLGEVATVAPGKLPPVPWHPRRFYYWGQYWLTRPFRGY